MYRQSDFKKRIDELAAFQLWDEHAITKKRGGAPSNIPAKRVEAAAHRARLIVQSYLCIVYLTDACFQIVAKDAERKSVARRCAVYMSTETMRDFRNAFAHANRCYNDDFSGLDCWVPKDRHKHHLGWRPFTVSEDDLTFWFVLTRGVTYSIHTSL